MWPKSLDLDPIKQFLCKICLYMLMWVKKYYENKNCRNWICEEKCCRKHTAGKTSSKPISAASTLHANQCLENWKRAELRKRGTATSKRQQEHEKSRQPKTIRICSWTRWAKSAEASLIAGIFLGSKSDGMEGIRNDEKANNPPTVRGCKGHEKTNIGNYGWSKIGCNKLHTNGSPKMRRNGVKRDRGYRNTKELSSMRSTMFFKSVQGMSCEFKFQWTTLLFFLFPFVIQVLGYAYIFFLFFSFTGWVVNLQYTLTIITDFPLPLKL